jgi:hypothetical protein
MGFHNAALALEVVPDDPRPPDQKLRGQQASLGNFFQPNTKLPCMSGCLFHSLLQALVSPIGKLSPLPLATILYCLYALRSSNVNFVQPTHSYLT